MTTGSDALAHRRLRAPREHGGVLIDPPLADVPRLIEANAARRAARDCDLQGRRLSDVAASGRRELVRLAERYTAAYRHVVPVAAVDRVFLAGHQPELFHPGVWFKNFALARLARDYGAVAVNLVIDSDTIKNVALRVPGGTPEAPLVESVAFDAASVEIPFEERSIEDRGRFCTFGARAADVLRPLVPDPLLREFWPLVCGRAGEQQNLGQCLSQARHQLEGSWGVSTLELPQSQVCQTEAFGWFTAHLLAELPRFREIYNQAVDAFRLLNHVRSANHPVPNLAAEGDWLEAPYWLWSTAEPRRRRLFVRRRGNELLLSNRRGIEFELPLAAGRSAGAAVEVLAALAERGVKLRSRALVTTLFARLVLGDLFLHGIGGAKYDQLTDALIEKFFGCVPPGFMVISATLHLPVAHGTANAAELHDIEGQLRDLDYHPERHLAAGDWPAEIQTRITEQLAEKARWIGTTQTRDNARQRCHAIRAANEFLRGQVELARRDLLARRVAAVQSLRASAVLTSREYAFALYPGGMLRDFLLAFGTASR